MEKIIIFILPNLLGKNCNCKNQSIFNFQIINILDFFELKTEFLRFQNVPPIDVSIHTNTKTNSELFLLLNSFLIVKRTNLQK